MIKPMRTLTLSALAATVLGGCVSQQKYDTVAETATSLDDRVARLNQENATLQATVDRQQARLGELETENRELRRTAGQLESNIGQLQESIGDVDARLTGMRFGLNPQTDLALRRLASANSALISYDPAQGMVRFASDLTFNSGSDVVKPEAAGALKQLAEVLLGIDAADYDLRVVGHTDNQKMSNPQTIQKHRNNRYLSAHRAIAVSESLQSYGIPASRIEVAGWGEQRPLVPNNAKGGTAANRRVEIFLVPGSGGARSDTMQGSSEGEAASDSGGAATDRRNFPVK